MTSFALPIISKSKAEILEIIDREASKFDFFEVWLDYIDGIDCGFVSQLLSLYGSKLIFLFRRMNFEAQLINSKLRAEILRMLSGSDALIDLDLIDQKLELQEFASALNQRLILSYHNYKMTPNLAELSDLVSRMEEFKPGVIKISCMCNSHADAIRLTELELILSEATRPHIVLGMGKYGKITRIMGPIIGSELCYAPINLDRASAAGQIELTELKRILELLKD